ncbi:MAG: hypothetical protein K6G03_08965 [Lachnospiraceae bacterium]|nr:hypothetical protein [Lachnospiraceae bacterium]
MKTEQVHVKNDGSGIERALAIPDNFAQTVKLNKKDALHLRLISEEMLGLVRAITGEFEADFWIEGDDKTGKICLEADVIMDAQKRRQLLASSTSGKNEEAKGVLGKIKELIVVGIENYEEVSKLQMMYGGSPLNYGAMGVENIEMSQAVITWSLQQYRNKVAETNDEDNAAESAWDELEKSVLANLADDVRVGINKDKVRINIYKSFS